MWVLPLGLLALPNYTWLHYILRTSISRGGTNTADLRYVYAGPHAVPRANRAGPGDHSPDTIPTLCLTIPYTYTPFPVCSEYLACHLHSSLPCSCLLGHSPDCSVGDASTYPVACLPGHTMTSALFTISLRVLPRCTSTGCLPLTYHLTAHVPVFATTSSTVPPDLGAFHLLLVDRAVI